MPMQLGLKKGTIPLRNAMIRPRPGNAPPWLFGLAIGIFRPETLISTPDGQTLDAWKNESLRAGWKGNDMVPNALNRPGKVKHNGFNGYPILQMRGDGYITTTSVPSEGSSSYSCYFVFRDMAYNQNGTYVIKFSNGLPLMYITHIDNGEVYNFGGGGGQATENVNGSWRLFYLEQTFGAAGAITLKDLKNGFSKTVAWDSQDTQGGQVLYASQDIGGLTLAYDYVEAIWLDEILPENKQRQIERYLKTKYLAGLPPARQAKWNYSSRVETAGGTIIDVDFTYNFINLLFNLDIWDKLLLALDANMGLKDVAGNATALFDLTGMNDPKIGTSASTQPATMLADPTLNDRNTLVFDGTDNRYIYPYKTINIVDSEGFYIAKNTGATQAGLISKYNVGQLIDESPTQIIATNPAYSYNFDTTHWHIAQMKMSANDKLQLGANGNLGAAVNHNLSAWSLSDLGSYSYHTYFKGSIAGWYQFQGSLTDKQRQAILNFLNEYYGVY